MTLELSEKNLLRPVQIAEMEDEKRRIEYSLSPNTPEHIRAQMQAPAEAAKTLRRLSHQLETQRPQPIAAEDRDEAVKAERELREKFTASMPTAAEMRRNPAGARDKNVGWQRRHKSDVLKWKNLRQRMHATAMLGEIQDATDVSNAERFRPVGGAQELNMDNEQIQGKEFHFPAVLRADIAVMSDEQAAMLKRLDPALFAKMPLLNNDDRAQVLAQVDILIADEAPSEEPPGAQFNEWHELRKRAADLGIEVGQKKKQQLLDEIASIEEG